MAGDSAAVAAAAPETFLLSHPMNGLIIISTTAIVSIVSISNLIATHTAN